MVYVSPAYHPLDDERDLPRCPVCEDYLPYEGAACSCFFA